jgi:hypothetical protein
MVYSLGGMTAIGYQCPRVVRVRRARRESDALGTSPTYSIATASTSSLTGNHHGDDHFFITSVYHDTSDHS